jgi:hypothetical protein
VNVKLSADSSASPYKTPVALHDGIEKAVNLVEKPAVSNGGGGGSGLASGGKFEPGVIQPPQTVNPDTIKAFDDLDSVEWAWESIEFLAGKNIISGDGDGNFRPGDAVTREEFIKMLVTALDKTEENLTADFSDAEAGEWYYPYIAAAQKNGITVGQGDGTFGVGSHITREEMAAMAYRGVTAVGGELPQQPSGGDFADGAVISEYARQAVAAMKSAGIINGTGGGNFEPKATANRAQAAKIIYGIVSLLEGFQ